MGRRFSSHPGLPVPLDSPTTAPHGSNRAVWGFAGVLFPYPDLKTAQSTSQAEFRFCVQNEITPPPKGGGAGYHLSWVGRVGSVRSKLGHAGSTGLTLFLTGVVPLPGPQNRTQGHTGARLVSPPFPGALLLRQPSKLSFQVVVDGFLDRTDGELQRSIPHLAGLGTHLGWFHVDELLLLQQANVLS